MSQFKIENDFFDVFPKAKFGILVCKGIDNTIENDDIYQALLDVSMVEAKKHLTNPDFSQNQVIQVWRQAFQEFKTKKGVRSSIEALLKRVNTGKEIGVINPLVDIYNSISLTYGLPCGGEDIDTFSGDVRLTKAVGIESFFPLGAEVDTPPYEGEIVYKDDAGAICRCWNWREAKRTMLTEKTTNAFMCIELVDESRLEVLKDALKSLNDLIVKHLGGKVTSYILDSDTHTIEL